ncbi:MAG: hypothetical protein ACKO9Q_25890, partial [Pirellula sp.]
MQTPKRPHPTDPEDRRFDADGPVGARCALKSARTNDKSVQGFLSLRFLRVVSTLCDKVLGIFDRPPAIMFAEALEVAWWL